jgi:hypothetical protein
VRLLHGDAKVDRDAAYGHPPSVKRRYVMMSFSHPHMAHIASFGSNAPFRSLFGVKLTLRQIDETRPNRHQNLPPRSKSKIICRLPVVVTDPYDGVMVGPPAARSSEVMQPAANNRASLPGNHSWYGVGLNPLISPGANSAKSVENDPPGT